MRLAWLAPLLLLPAAALACFGAELRVGVGKERPDALYSYALGYFVEEKTGIAPLFIEVEDVEKAFAEEKIDVKILPSASPAPKGAVSMAGGAAPSFGEAVIWLRPDIREDIRFTTLERALGIIGGFFSSPGMKSAAESAEDPKKAARKAVIDAE
ncbi:hypothetical protein EPN96_12620 [bacterium]|nr:MAG: hypothetical protein EPN96_12620 [bacterium]